MDWYWGLIVVFICFCLLLLLRYLREQCKLQPDYRRGQNYQTTNPPSPGFTVGSQRVPLSVQRTRMSMPMPNAGFANRGTSSLEHISRNNPYPPTSPNATAPYPIPFDRQLSSTAEDLPPSYNDAMQHSNNIRRPYSEGISNRHTIITSTITNPQHIANLPYGHQTNVPVYNVIPQPHLSYTQPHHQLHNLTDDLPPSYSEAVNIYSKNKI